MIQQRFTPIRWLIGLAMLAPLTPLCAQIPVADLNRIEPHAAKAGDSLELSVFGSNLDDLDGLRFSHPGITASRIPLPENDIYPEVRYQPTRFKVNVGSEVPPGIYEVSTLGYFGISTARPFVVVPQNANEILETGDHSARDKAMPLEVNSVVSGFVDNRGIDWYKIQVKAGQRVTIEVVAERIDSRLDGLLVLYDAQGRELEQNRQRYGRDPFLEVVPNADGEFYLALSDILYRGGAEHFYRLKVSDQPHVDFVYPPAGEPGKLTKFRLYGRNLPGGSMGDAVSLNGQPLESVEVEVQVPTKAELPKDYFPGTPRQGILPGFIFPYLEKVPVRIGFATAPVQTEASDPTPQQITVPTEIAGRFDEAGDEGTYRFMAEAGKSYTVEVYADRLGSNVDPFLVVQRVKREGSQEVFTKVAENDDLPSFFSADGKDSLNADTNDSWLTFKCDEDGEYQVTLGNHFGNGDSNALYRLAIREPQPDFQILAATERPLADGRAGFSVTPLLRRGAKWAVRILAPRQDEFAGDIEVTAEDLPPGVTAKPLVLSGKTDRGVLVLSAAEDAATCRGTFRITGRAKMGDLELVREAKFAGLVWGYIFADSIRVRSRLATEIPLAVQGEEQAPAILTVVDEQPRTVELGKSLELTLKVKDNLVRKGNLTVEPYGLAGLLRSPPTANIEEKGTEGKLTISFAPNGNFLAAPGTYQFSLQGTGVSVVRSNLQASERAAAELARIIELQKQLQLEVTQAQGTLEMLKKELEVAKQLAAASKPEEKPARDAAVKTAQETVTQAEQTAKQAAERVKRGEQAKADADRVAQATAKAAQEKDEKFAIWSELLTVTVTEPVKAK